MATYFASGSNHPGEIDGFARAGMNLGATVSEFRKGTEEALRALALTATLIFIDSGAFGEIGFGPNGPFVKKPITAEDWNERLDTYDRLAEALGSQLFVVAPDRVAFQAHTLSLLETYAPRVRALAATGANVLVPHQKGELSLSEFNARAHEILGCDFIPAIPMKKDATDVQELVTFLETVRPSSVHLLGLGINSPRFSAVEAACLAACPGLSIFCDSVAITSKVGRTGGRNGGPRPLTLAQDFAREEMIEGLFADGLEGLDYTDAIGEPSAWLTSRGTRELANLIGLDADETAELIANVDGWLQDDDRYLWPHVEAALDTLWARFVEKATVAARKSRAIESYFGARPALSGAARDVLAGMVANGRVIDADVLGELEAAGLVRVNGRRARVTRRGYLSNRRARAAGLVA